MLSVAQYGHLMTPGITLVATMVEVLTDTVMVDSFLSPYYAYHPRKVEMPIETSSICSAPRHRAISYRITVQLLALLQQPGKAIIRMSKSVQMAGYRLPRSQRQIRASGGTPSIGLSHPSSKKYLRLHRL